MPAARAACAVPAARKCRRATRTRSPITTASSARASRTGRGLTCLSQGASFAPRGGCPLGTGQSQGFGGAHTTRSHELVDAGDGQRRNREGSLVVEGGGNEILFRVQGHLPGDLMDYVTRCAAHDGGQKITWEMILNSKQD